ncbi:MULTISPECIES: M20/M25/M40 family metallo-hydrolase [Chitinophagaceae]
MWQKLIFFLLIILVVVLVICIVRFFLFKSIQPNNALQADIPIRDSAISHFQQGLQFQTISYDDRPTDSAAFAQFQQFLTQKYPHVFQQLEKETFEDYTLLLKWNGQNPNRPPIVLMAHQDVVPVDPLSLSDWKAKPFAGKIIGDTLYGRGAVDDKCCLFSILEAAEMLLQEGFQPPKPIYLVFGHNEEKMGSGVAALVAALKVRNIHPKWVFDEGGEFTETVPGLKGRKVALIGTSEKGYLSVQLKVDTEGGHSSMPASQTSIDVLIAAIQNIRSHPFPASFTSSMNGFMDYLGPEMSATNKFFVANRWLFNRLLLKIYSQTAPGNALIRTSIAPTIVAAGTKENVIPNIATATINLRTAPGTTTQQVLEHLQKSVNDRRVTITPIGKPTEASDTTSVDSEAFTHLANAIKENYSGVLVTPYLMVGTTDGRKFGEICSNIVRFAPITDLKGMHGVNERVGIEEFKKSIGLYYRVMKGSGF